METRLGCVLLACKKYGVYVQVEEVNKGTRRWDAEEGSKNDLQVGEMPLCVGFGRALLGSVVFSRRTRYAQARHAPLVERACISWPCGNDIVRASSYTVGLWHTFKSYSDRSAKADGTCPEGESNFMEAIVQ